MKQTLLAVLLLGTALWGCDSKKAAPPTGASTGTSSGTVSAKAGGVVGDASGASVTVPPGAVDKDALIEMAPKPVEAYVTPAVQVVGPVWSFRVDGQDHFKFARPVRLALPYDPSRLREGAPVGLSVWQDGCWQKVPGARVEAASKQVVAEVDHFTEFTATQDALENAFEDARKRILNNEFWYGTVHLVIRGTGRQGNSSYSISREAGIKFRVRAEKGDLAGFAILEQMKKSGVRMPSEGEAAMDKVRNIRHWKVNPTNRDPQDEIDLFWNVDDRWDDPTTTRTIRGGDSGKFMGMPVVIADILKGNYNFGLGLGVGTIVTTVTPKGGTGKPTPKPATVSWKMEADLPAQGNVLSGRTQGQRLGGNIGDGGVWTFNYGSTQATMTWTLSPVPLEDVELVLVPDGYDSWLPKGGKDEATIGSTIPMKALLRHRGGGPAKAQMEDIVVRMMDFSSEPGVCLNRPLVNGATTPDLKFSSKTDGTVATDGMEILKKGKFTSVSFEVDSFDWGAWGSVSAVATLTDGRPVWSEMEGDPKTNRARLPKRDKDSWIGEAWKNRPEIKASGADTDDLDKQQGNANDGDGLTLYEEYRGLIAKGVHTRDHPAGKDGFKPLTPGRKDLLVHNTMEEGTAHPLLPGVRKGIELFQSASGIHVVQVLKDELPQSRQVNVNFGRLSAGPQYGLRMFHDSALPQPGQTAGGGGDVRGPSLTRSPMGFSTVKLNLDMIQSNHKGFVTRCKLTGVKVPHTLEESTANGAAHELGHGLGVKHHGDDQAATVNQPQKLTAVDTDGLVFPVPANLSAVGELHNTSSGDVNCIMTYNNMWAWGFHWPDKIYLAPILPEGTIFCTSAAGTGANAPHPSSDGKRTIPGVFGNATQGNCLGQMRVKDQ